MFAAARAWWFVRRPHTHGSVVAIWQHGRVLIVQSSYRRQFGFPGGFQKRGETALETARREIFEELRFTISPAALTLAWEGSTAFEHRRDTTTIWEATFDVPPAIRVDGREIVAALWKTPDEARALPLTPPVAAYLERRSSRLLDASAADAIVGNRSESRGDEDNVRSAPLTGTGCETEGQW